MILSNGDDESLQLFISRDICFIHKFLVKLRYLCRIRVFSKD